MIDQNAFINTYIDVIINSIQEYLKSSLQLQTQIKVNELVIANKDQIISSLTQQINENKVAEDWKVKYESAEHNYAEAMNKLSHMDTLLNQLSDMKKTIIKKDEEIAELKCKLSNNKTSKTSETKVINTKEKKKVEEPVKKDITEIDDF